MQPILADLGQALRMGLIMGLIGGCVGALIGLVSWAVKKRPKG